MKKAIKKVGAKITDVASDMMSAPRRMMEENKQMDADMKRKALLTARNMKGAMDEGDYKDPLFRARATAAAVKAKYKVFK